MARVLLTEFCTELVYCILFMKPYQLYPEKPCPGDPINGPLSIKELLRSITGPINPPSPPLPLPDPRFTLMKVLWEYTTYTVHTHNVKWCPVSNQTLSAPEAEHTHLIKAESEM